MTRFVLFLGLLCAILGVTLGHPPLQEHRQRGNKLTSKHNKNLGSADFSRLFEIEPRYRLNDTFIPSHYEIELLVILDDDPVIGQQYTVPGKVTIDAQPTGNTDTITLHANLLEINYESIVITSGSRPTEVINVVGMSNDTNDELHFLTLTVDTTLQAFEDYQIYIEYIAPISTNRLDGIYLSSYVDPQSGVVKRIATTQNEPCAARQIFPSFDEPDLKATFSVTVIRNSNYSALHNTELVSTFDDPTRPGYKIDKFATSVKMSTYIFALIVSDFKYTQADAAIFGDKPVRVYAQPDLIERGGGIYPAEVSAQILQFYNEYFDAEYPLQKMDSVAMPDFSAGAMENYGLNIYRINLLMYFPDETTETARYSITNVLAHELGHQNFGNLVTCKWWTNLWLNEGFATYVSYLGSQAVRPEFRFLEDQLNDAFQYSMVVDASAESHPLVNDALTPTEIDNYFTGITYEKGGSIIRMVEKFLTEETMRKGLQYYLQDMKFQGSLQDDLFRNLDKAATEDNRLSAGLTVKTILDTWTLQTGFPLVRVNVASGNQVQISQERYVNGPSKQEPTGLWYVPVTVVTQDKPTLENHIPEFWMRPSANISYVVSHDTSKWIMVNQDATGYYRVLYDNILTSLIQKQLEEDPSVISPLSRSQLLDDYFTFAFQRKLDVETALNLTKYLEQEDHFTVWDVVFTQLRKTYNLLGAHPTTYQPLKEYLLPRVASALSKVGVEQSPEHIGAAGIYRVALLDWACSMEHPDCYNYATKLLTQWQANPQVNPVNKDTQSILYCAMVASGGAEAFDFIVQRYQEQPDSSTQKSFLLNALACVKDTQILSELLSNVVDDTSPILLSDTTTLIQRVASNSAGRSVVINMLIERVEDIIKLIGSANPIGSIVSTLSTYLSTQDDLEMLTKFISDDSEILAPINNSLQTSLRTINSNIDWVSEFGNDIVKWLSDSRMM